MNKHLDEIEKYKKKYHDISFVSNVKSGKEADVIKVQADERVFALKVYKDRSILSSRNEYIAGKWIREKSLRKSIQKKNKVGKNLLEKLWTKREFYLLGKLKEKGANVPDVYEFSDKSILMEYLGDDHNFAPRLRDTELSVEEYDLAFNQILNSIRIFLDSGIVHGDLSEYNILWWEGKPFIIDFPQSIDIRTNRNAEDMLTRDVENLCNYFKNYIKIEKYKGLISNLKLPI